MNSNELKEIFRGIIPDALIETIAFDYPKYGNTPLAHLGVDSLSYLEIVFRMEKEYNIRIDYENFNLEDFTTLGRMDAFLSRVVDQKKTEGL